MKKLPKELLVYIYDYDNGKPVYAVALNTDDIPEDCSGNPVGTYTLNRTYSFRVRRELA